MWRSTNVSVPHLLIEDTHLFLPNLIDLCLCKAQQEDTTKNCLHLILVRKSQVSSQFHASASPCSAFEHFHPSILASLSLTCILMQIWGLSCGHRGDKKQWSAAAMESAISSRSTSKESCYILVWCPQHGAAYSLVQRGTDQQGRVPGKSQQGCTALLNMSSLKHFQPLI